MVIWKIDRRRLQRNIIILITCAIYSGVRANDPIFIDISSQAGIGNELAGHSAVFTDVNDDGLPDIYITRQLEGQLPDFFYVNIGNNRFLESGSTAGIENFHGGSHGVVFADIDNDGDYDFYNGTTGASFGWPSGMNRLYRNDGSGHFIDITEESGLPVRHWETRGVAAVDIDDDGYLDLLGITNYLGNDDPPAERNELYRNIGGGHFESINSGDFYTCLAGQGITASDFDGDGDVDIFAANRTGSIHILKNDGMGNFSAIDPSSIGINHSAGDGITLADFNYDGYMDILLASDNIGYLYRGIAPGQFTFHQIFENTDGYMGAFADVDNDTDLDLIFAGDDVCYLNDGSGHFYPGPSINVNGINDPRAVAFADIDNDGDVDFLYACKRSRNFLFRNDLPPTNWLKLRLISTHGQAGAYGAKIYLYPTGASDPAMVIGFREARSTNGYLGQNDPVLHFGLGAHESVDIVVKFPDGTVWEKSAVAKNQTILVDGRKSGVIAGNIQYFAHEGPVSGRVMLYHDGMLSDSTSTDEDGAFQFQYLHIAQNYAVECKKNSLEDCQPLQISLYDAALAALAAAGTFALSPEQILAADVNQDGMVTVQDADAIADYAVGNTPSDGYTPGKWVFNPSRHDYQPVGKVPVIGIFKAILCGDVDGK